MNLIMVLLIGTSIGLILSRFIFKEKPVGSLRVDQSDPDPLLFPHKLRNEKRHRRRKDKLDQNDLSEHDHSRFTLRHYLPCHKRTDKSGCSHTRSRSVVRHM